MYNAIHITLRLPYDVIIKSYNVLTSVKFVCYTRFRCDDMSDDQKGREKMMSFTFRIAPSLIEQLKDKAGSIPVSVVIRRLIEKYLKGEIGLD